MGILGFKCPDTEALFKGVAVPRFRNIQRAAERKLWMLDSAETIAFLRSPPGNRLKQMSADRVGQYSLRINDQFRLCFIWSEAGPHSVEIVDYH